MKVSVHAHDEEEFDARVAKLYAKQDVLVQEVLSIYPQVDQEKLANFVRQFSSHYFQLASEMQTRRDDLLAKEASGASDDELWVSIISATTSPERHWRDYVRFSIQLIGNSEGFTYELKNIDGNNEFKIIGDSEVFALGDDLAHKVVGSTLKRTLNLVQKEFPSIRVSV